MPSQVTVSNLVSFKSMQKLSLQTLFLLESMSLLDRFAALRNTLPSHIIHPIHSHNWRTSNMLWIEWLARENVALNHEDYTGARI